MKFETFRKNILGKVYTRDYHENDIYVVVDVCGRPNSNSENPEIRYAAITYLYFTKPNESSVTSFRSDCISISVDYKEIDIKYKEGITSLKNTWHESRDASIDDVVNYYKTLNATVKSYLREIGANL